MATPRARTRFPWRSRSLVALSEETTPARIVSHDTGESPDWVATSLGLTTPRSDGMRAQKFWLELAQRESTFVNVGEGLP